MGGEAGVFSALWPADGAALEREFLRTPSGERLRYREVLERSARLAHALVARGVRPGDRVAVQVQKSPEALLLYFATLRAGAVYLPLNDAYTVAELEYFLGDAQPSLLVCAPERYHALKELATRLQVGAASTLPALLERAAGQSGRFEDVARSAHDLAAILYTSGTTGRAKGAMLTVRNLVSNARTLVRYWQFERDDRLLHALPIHHIHGLFVAVNVTLAAGASLIYLPRFEVDAVLRGLPEATVMMGVPTYYVRLLGDARLQRERTAGIRLFISGSAPLLVETHRTWLERTGHRILERYGLSETGMNCSNPYEGERVPGTVGPALPGVELRISARDRSSVSNAPLPSGAVGLIEVRGPNVFKGYWHAPERTREVLTSDGWFCTGDLGCIDARGYLSIVGRAKDLIITGGLNVYPKEVETEIDALPGVLESAVIGLAHRDLGEAVTAVVVPSTADHALNEEQLLVQLRRRLAPFKLPKRVLFAPELPRNAMGKIQKALLRERYAQLYAPEQSRPKDSRAGRGR